MGIFSSELKNKKDRYKRRLYESLGNPKYTAKYGLNDLDTKLEKYLNYRTGFFIEAGANDGLKQSNTYYLERGRLWRGILIEPIPELYKKCVQARTRSKVYQCALVAPEYEGDTISIHFAGLMSVVNGSMPIKDLKAHVKAGLDCQDIETTYEIDIPVATLESVIDKYGAESRSNRKRLSRGIDLLSLDVEGYERKVLEGLNLLKYRPRYILVEARYFEEVDSFLHDHSYSLIEQLTYHDYLYVDNS